MILLVLTEDGMRYFEVFTPMEVDNMQNVGTSAVNPKRSNKNASLRPEAHNFRSTPNGMVRTI